MKFSLGSVVALLALSHANSAAIPQAPHSNNTAFQIKVVSAANSTLNGTFLTPYHEGAGFSFAFATANLNSTYTLKDGVLILDAGADNPLFYTASFGFPSVPFNGTHNGTHHFGNGTHFNGTHHFGNGSHHNGTHHFGNGTHNFSASTLAARNDGHEFPDHKFPPPHHKFPPPPPHFNHTGFNHTGFNHTGFNHTGFNHTGFNFTGFNHTGFNHTGFNHTGFNFTGFNHSGPHHPVHPIPVHPIPHHPGSPKEPASPHPGPVPPAGQPQFHRRGVPSFLPLQFDTIGEQPAKLSLDKLGHLTLHGGESWFACTGIKNPYNYSVPAVGYLFDNSTGVPSNCVPVTLVKVPVA